MIFEPPCLGGRSCQICDCVRLLRAVGLPCRVLNLVNVYEGFAPFPRCCVRISWLRSCRCISGSLWLPCSVCLVSLFGAVLTYSICYSVPIRSSPMLPALQGTSMESCLPSRNGQLFNRSQSFSLMKVGFYSIVGLTL